MYKITLDAETAAKNAECSDGLHFEAINNSTSIKGKSISRHGTALSKVVGKSLKKSGRDGEFSCIVICQ